LYVAVLAILPSFRSVSTIQNFAGTSKITLSPGPFPQILACSPPFWSCKLISLLFWALWWLLILILIFCFLFFVVTFLRITWSELCLRASEIWIRSNFCETWFLLFSFNPPLLLFSSDTCKITSFWELCLHNLDASVNWRDCGEHYWLGSPFSVLDFSILLLFRDVSNNQLSGTLPTEWQRLANLSRLYGISLSTKQFPTTDITSFFFSVLFLERFLHENALVGPPPISLSYLPLMTIMFMSSNFFDCGVNAIEDVDNIADFSAWLYECSRDSSLPFSPHYYFLLTPFPS